MDIFLLECLLITWLSVGAARKLYIHLGDRLLTAALLGWGIIVATCLLLSAFHRLSDRAWFLGLSLILSFVVCVCLCQVQRQATGQPPEMRPNGWLLGMFVLILTPLACICGLLAYVYEPGNPASLTYHLPRVMYYLGQGTLAHFDAADLRQVQLPFNHDLLQLFALIHEAPLQSLNFFSILAWVLCGVAIYRLCVICGASANASLITCGLALTATGVLAQAGSTTPELPVSLAVLSAAIFVLQWHKHRAARDALLAGLSVGLAVGSDLRAMLSFATGLSSVVLLAWRHPGLREGLRPWLKPLLLSAVIGLPFLIINLASGTLGLGALGTRPVDELAHAFWYGWAPFWLPSSTGLELSDDNAGFGLVGPLFTLTACLCIRKQENQLRWLAAMGFAWTAAVLILHRLSLHPRDFIPALLIVSPCFARKISMPSPGVRLGLALVALATFYSTGIYLLKNSRRPLEPLLNSSLVSPGVPTLPLLVSHRMTKQPWINIESDSTNERIFPFMVQGRHQRFTALRAIEPEAYNLFSRSSVMRNAAYVSLERSPAYFMVPVESKRTAGVEFLATIGQGQAARDYFGLEPGASRTKPIMGNRTLLVTVERVPTPVADPPKILIRLAGLNPDDNARLVAELELPNGKSVRVATLLSNGEATAAIRTPFHALSFRAIENTSGREIGSARMNYHPQYGIATKPIDKSQPSGANSMFVTDLVLSADTHLIRCDGLLPVEGPFPQWDIPYIRWARVPSVLLKIAPVPHLARLQLSFSFRLHVRKIGSVELFFNGKRLKHYDLEGQLNWMDESLDLAPAVGENVLEFRDATHKSEPDWMAYLELYPDVKSYVLGHDMAKEAGAREHYEAHGRAEGRTLPTHPTNELEPAYESYYFMFRNLRLEGFKSP